MRRTITAALLFGFGLTALGQDGKTELRYAFKKGDKFPIKIVYAVSVKLDKVPEILQGVVSEDPIDVKFDGTLDAEVSDVAESGTALLTGAWRLAKAKGHIMVNDIDFDYDSSKKADDKPKKKADEDPALAGFQDMQDQLAKMVHTPLKLSVDKFGKTSFAEGSGKVGQLEGAFRSLNGLMGPLPKDAKAKGDTWKDDLKMELPGVPGNVPLKIRAENTVASVESIEGKQVCLIKSKYAVGKQPGDKDEEPAADLQVKIKTDGSGEGSTLFSLTDGRAVKSSSVLKIKVNAQIPNPGGGDEMELKAQVKIEMAHQLGAK